MKKLMLGLMMAFAVTAEAAVTIDGFKYELDTEAKTATLTGYEGSPTELNVSEVEWEGQKYSVTSVGGYAFEYCSSLTSVLLPNATTIEQYAFYMCQNLKEVSLPNATTIGEHAFYMCQNLKEVSLPNATTIGAGAFFWCQMLTSVSLPNATLIGSQAFYSCSSLTSVYLPKATTIGERAFYSCGLTSVYLPKATTFGVNAFQFCDELKQIYVNVAMKRTLKSNRGYYGIVGGCEILSPTVEVEPRPAEHSTAKVYTNGVEVTDSPFYVLPNATVDVVFMAAEGYCFADDHSTAQTNTVTATDDLTEVDGPTVVKIPSLKEDETQQARYVVQEAEVETNVQLTVSSEVKVLPSVTLKSGDTVLNQTDYEYACEFYGIPKQAEPSVPAIPAKPTADDFKIVSKDAQVVPPPPVPPPGAVTTWDALTNAVATAEKGAEIAVGADITEAGGELVVPKDKAVTIKLYGKTVLCGSVTVGGALTVGDAEDLVGKIVATDGAKITSSGLVTLLGGPVRGTFAAKSPGVVMLFQ